MNIQSFLFATFLHFVFNCLLTGRVDSVTFEQPSSLIVEKGFKDLRIDCKHDDSSLAAMLWYQHKQSSQTMALIGYTVVQSEPEYEPHFKERFNITRMDMLRGHLKIGTADPADSAVYFCAASTQ